MARQKCTFKWQGLKCTVKWQDKSVRLNDRTNVYI